MSITKVFKSLKEVKRTFSTANLRQKDAKERSFEDAIIALNLLQPNSAELSKSIQMRQQQRHDEANFNLTDTQKYLERIDGFKLSHLDKLSFIHVSGSKGKGSVCVYTEAILREHNVKTGLFTSPHLMSVTERIKLRGRSISQQLFTEYFFEVFDALQRKKDNEFDLPSYFKFLQIMAFYIFVRENVDVAIVEVGIGGQYDSTNIIRNSEIVAITALQLEHTQLLGETINEIAWQKAGIIKENSHVYIVPQQPVCKKVIKERFIEKKGKSLSVSPSFGDYNWMNSCPDFSKTSEVNKLNFSLAAQISARWLRNRSKISTNLFKNDVLFSINDKFVDAFNKCQNLGRFQRIDQENLTYFFDGAHTKDSMVICANWFLKQTENSKDSINILVFNVTGDRDSAAILGTLHSLNFHYVLFSTNISNSDSENGKCGNFSIVNQCFDNLNVEFKLVIENFNGALNNSQLERCITHKKIWEEMTKPNFNESSISICPTIQQALESINDIKENNSHSHFNILFTGSLHLVGSALGQLKYNEGIDNQLSAKAKRVKTEILKDLNKF